MIEDYRKKLENFNKKDKYLSEVRFLFDQIGDRSTPRRILDFGAGIGTLSKFLSDNFNAHVYPYDKNIFPNPLVEVFNSIPEQKKFDEIIFMHSIAHIPNITQELFRLKRNSFTNRTRVHIITPNIEWLKVQSNDQYVPDPTVFQHYTQDELIKLLELIGLKIEVSLQFGNYQNGYNERIYIRAS